MTRSQHETTRLLAFAEKQWLESYGWIQSGFRYRHTCAPLTRPDYSLRDAVSMTRSDLLRYGSAVRSVG